jgi:hypothetical protein
MIIAICIILLFLFLIYTKLMYPWHFIDGGRCNILGKNKFGKTRQEDSKNFEEYLKNVYQNK